MEIVIVTGMSGAGKSSALNIFEDLGYYSMDNLPTELIIDFAKLTSRSEVIIDKLAVGIDIRGIGFEDTLREIKKLEESDFEFLFKGTKKKEDLILWKDMVIY